MSIGRRRSVSSSYSASSFESEDDYGDDDDDNISEKTDLQSIRSMMQSVMSGADDNNKVKPKFTLKQTYDLANKVFIGLPGRCSRCSRAYRCQRLADKKMVVLRKIRLSSWQCRNHLGPFLKAFEELAILTKLAKHDNILHVGELIQPTGRSIYLESEYFEQPSKRRDNFSFIYRSKLKYFDLKSSDLQMPSVCQGTLQDLMNAKFRTDKMFSSRQVLSIMLQIATGVQFLQDQKPIPLIHRDIKPQNIFIFERSSVEPLMKLGNFTIPTQFETCSHGSSFTASWNYSAPEILREACQSTTETHCKTTWSLSALDAASTSSDVWSMGVLFYQLLTGRLPFSGTSPKDVLNSISKECSCPIEGPNSEGLIKALPSNNITSKHCVSVRKMVTNQILLQNPKTRIQCVNLRKVMDLELSKINFLTAVKDGDLVAAKTLLNDRSAQDTALLIDQKDKYDRTPLMWASEFGNEGMVAFLLDKLDRMIVNAGEKPKRMHQNKMGWTAFDYSKTSRIEQMTQFSTVPGTPLRKSRHEKHSS